MRPAHRQAPTIDYRDRARPNLRLLGGTLLLGITIGAASVLLASMTRPTPPAGTTAVSGGAPASASAPEAERTLEPPARTTALEAVAAYKANEFKNALIKQSPTLRACYDSFLLDEPDVPEGKVTIDFQIDPDGKVIAPAVVESELESTALSDCLVARVAGFSFPPPPERQKTYAAHTFQFQKDVR